MFDNPQEVSASDYPKDAFVLIEHADTMGAFIRAADNLIQQNEHRNIFWRPPGVQNKQDMIELLEEGEHHDFICRGFDIMQDWREQRNIHLDVSSEKPYEGVLLGGRFCKLTASIEGEQGTYFFYVSPDTPGRAAFYERAAVDLLYENESYEFRAYKDNIRGPFFLAAQHVGLLLPSSFDSQATLHGIPVPRRESEMRKTYIAYINPTGTRLG
ncbi:MAG: hypothetical protein R3D66_02095 [Alphaproteobacteria bacterium]